MPEWLASTLIQYPILTLFLAVGLGYLVGEIPVFGFRFGAAGVLFVGLALGALHPEIALPEVVPTVGLIIFVYAIGIHSGPALAAAFRTRGYRDSLLAVGVLTFGAALTLALTLLRGLGGARAALMWRLASFMTHSRRVAQVGPGAARPAGWPMPG
jgi:putative transport protein